MPIAAKLKLSVLSSRLRPKFTRRLHLKEDVTAFNMARFVIFGDSRVKFLANYLQYVKPPLVEAKVVDVGGGRIRAVISEAISYLVHHPYDVTILMAGICDMTVFNPETQRYRLVFTTEDELTNHMVGLYNEADINFHRHCPHATLIIAQLTGEDLNRYAYAEDVTADLQDMFNRAVIEINKEIVAINRRNWVKTPWIARQIHRYRGGNVFTHHYDLLSDGIHPTNSTLRFWARTLASLMKKCS